MSFIFFLMFSVSEAGICQLSQELGRMRVVSKEISD